MSCLKVFRFCLPGIKALFWQNFTKEERAQKRIYVHTTTSPESDHGDVSFWVDGVLCGCISAPDVAVLFEIGDYQTLCAAIKMIADRARTEFSCGAEAIG